MSMFQLTLMSLFKVPVAASMKTTYILKISNIFVAMDTLYLHLSIVHVCFSSWYWPVLTLQL